MELLTRSVPAHAKRKVPKPSKRLTASTGRVVTLTVIDQGASSLSNFALAAIVAHYSGARELGFYAIVTSTYIIGQGLVRSCTSDCLLTRSETDDVVMARFEQAGYLAATLAAVAVSLLILAICIALPSSLAVPMVIFAACFPFMAMQDFSRYIGISRHDPAYSFRLDMAWLVLFIGGVAFDSKTGHLTLPWLLAAWTVSGALVGLWTARSHLVLRGVRGHLRFWRESEFAVGWRFAGQFLLTSSWGYAIFYLLALVLSVGALGVFKLAQLGMGPLTVAVVGLQSAMISTAAKKFPGNPGRTLRFIFAAGTGTAAVTVLWTAAVYFLPVKLMTNILGPTWPQARHIVIWVGIGVAISSWSGAAAAGLRALRAAKENLWLAVALLPFLLVPAMVGATVDGIRGAAIGTVFSSTFTSLFGWIVLIRTSRRRRLSPDAEPAAPPVPGNFDPA